MHVKENFLHHLGQIKELKRYGRQGGAAPQITSFDEQEQELLSHPGSQKEVQRWAASYQDTYNILEGFAEALDETEGLKTATLNNEKECQKALEASKVMLNKLKEKLKTGALVT